VADPAALDTRIVEALAFSPIASLPTISRTSPSA